MLLGVQVSPYVILFIDGLGILLVVLPILVPIAQQLGFYQLWFATSICVNLQMAFLTPSFGYCYSLFYLKGIAPEEMTIVNIYKGVVPFICLQWIGLITCIIFPQLVLWLRTSCLSNELIV